MGRAFINRINKNRQSLPHENCFKGEGFAGFLCLILWLKWEKVLFFRLFHSSISLSLYPIRPRTGSLGQLAVLFIFIRLFRRGFLSDLALSPGKKSSHIGPVPVDGKDREENGKEDQLPLGMENGHLDYDGG